MRSTFSQPYDEEFARRCIKLLFPQMFSELELNKNDPPDLVDEKSNIGIEVVRAIENEDAELSNAFATYRNKHISSVPDKLKKKITLGFKGLVCDNE